MAGTAANPTERALSGARLPDRLDGWRVLAIGGDAPRGRLDELGVEDFVSLPEPSEAAGVEPAEFDLAICGSGLRSDIHPLAVYAWLRQALKPEGLLVAGSEVIPDPTRSQYARFAPRAGEGPRWLPGTLAFRWMVEVSGFDVLRWLDPADEGPGPRAHLEAKAVDRAPALDLARQPLSR